MNSWKVFSAFCWLLKIFPAKSCWDAWRSGSLLARGQVNGGSDKTSQTNSSTFEALVVWHAVRCCGEVGPLCWPMPTIGIAVFSASYWFTSILLRCDGFTGIQKTVVDQTGRRPPNSALTIFWSKFGFGKCFGASPSSSHWIGHPWLSYKIHFSSHITIRSRNSSLLLCRIREERKCESLSVVSDSLRPMDIQSMGFSRPEYYSGYPFPYPGVFPTHQSNPGLQHCRQILYQLSHKGSP